MTEQLLDFHNVNAGVSQDRLQMTSQTAAKGGNLLMGMSYSYAAGAGASGGGSVAGNSGQLMGVTATIGRSSFLGPN